MFIVKADLPSDMDRLFIEMNEQKGNAPYVAPTFLIGNRFLYQLQVNFHKRCQL